MSVTLILVIHDSFGVIRYLSVAMFPVAGIYIYELICSRHNKQTNKSSQIFQLVSQTLVEEG